MKKSNTKVVALPILLTNNTIHETTSLITNIGAASIAPAVITIIQFAPLSLIVTIRILGRVLFTRNLTTTPRSIH